MKIRNLKLKDSAGMLEWMKDSQVNCWFRFNPDSMTKETVEEFILCNDNTSKKDFHFAIVDDTDNYMGTISLKHVDYENSNAEYAIVLRQQAQGKGYASFATREILKYAFNELHLHRVYLNVLSENEHAWKFYEHMSFNYEGESKECLLLNGEYKSLKWYSIINK